MKIGVVLPSAGIAPEGAVLAEKLGFDAVTCGEHIFFPGTDTHSSFVVLAAAAAVTSRVRLVSTVALLPLYPAPLAAKQAATLSQISGNRFEFGVGIGGEQPAEFIACGINPADRSARTDRSLEIVTQLLRGDPMTIQGVEYFLEPSVTPPPIWIGGRHRNAWRRAGRFGDRWMPYMYTPEMLSSSLKEVRAYAIQFRRDPERMAGGVLLHVYVCASGQEARARALRNVTTHYGGRVGKSVSQYVVAGSPTEVTSRLLEYQAAGADFLVLSLACSSDQWPQMLNDIAEEVLPHVQS